MCHQNVSLYLHCSHIVLEPKVQICNQHQDEPPSCGVRSGPVVHSYMLCCPACRGRMEHTHDTIIEKGICSEHDSRATTFPTCARLWLKTPSDVTPQRAFEFPYGLGLSSTTSHITQENAIATPFRNLHEPEFTSTLLRFPLTKCHHLHPFGMPVTYLDDKGQSTLPCGCWTGKAPASQMAEAALFVDFIGGDSTFQSVWDVTGVGQIGCWTCKKLERDAQGNYVGDIRETDCNSANSSNVDIDMKVKKFLEDVAEWQSLEDWKDEHMGGDIEERGAKLMADSRWNNEGPVDG